MLENYKVLVVDDDPDIVELIRYNLLKEGYQVESARNGDLAIKLARVFKPDLILLDVMMPEMDGIEACRQLREEPELKDVVIAFLSARAEDFTQIAGFDAGADDYILKPIKPRLLVSRVKGLLRRVHVSESAPLSSHGISVNRERFIIEKDGTEIFLPKKEFELFSLLFSKPGKVFTREEILAKVWGDEVVVGDRTIDVHIRKLREKLGEELIRTIKGVGYKIEG